MKTRNSLIHSPLAREITAVLVFKALALTALYFAFFSGPAPNASLSPFAPAAYGNADGGVR